MLEEKIEEAFWDFDGAHKGYGQYKDGPLSERDAFKMILRKFVNLESTFSQPKDNYYTGGGCLLESLPSRQQPTPIEKPNMEFHYHFQQNL